MVITPIMCQAGTLRAGLPPAAQAGTIILLSLSQALQHHPAASDNELQHGRRTQQCNLPPALPAFFYANSWVYHRRPHSSQPSNLSLFQWLCEAAHQL